MRRKGEQAAGPASEEGTAEVPAERPPRVESSSVALRQVSEPQEVTTSTDVVGAGGAQGDIGGRTLSNLIKARVFMAMFCWLADRQFSTALRPDTRVARLRAKDTRLYWTCVVLDLIVTLGAVVLLMCAASIALYKTFVL